MKQQISVCMLLYEGYVGPVCIIHIDACCFMILNDFTHLKACLCFRISLCRCPFLYCAGNSWSLKTLLCICKWLLIHIVATDVSCLRNVTLPRKFINFKPSLVIPKEDHAPAMSLIHNMKLLITFSFENDNPILLKLSYEVSSK